MKRISCNHKKPKPMKKMNGNHKKPKPMKRMNGNRKKREASHHAPQDKLQALDLSRDLQLTALTWEQLTSLCRRSKLVRRGTKKDLIERLTQALTCAGAGDSQVHIATSDFAVEDTSLPGSAVQSPKCKQSALPVPSNEIQFGNRYRVISQNGELLGEGSFGRVVKAVHVESEQMVALKLSEGASTAAIKREIEVYSCLWGGGAGPLGPWPFLRILESCSEGPLAWCAMPWVSHGSLHAHVKTRGPLGGQALKSAVLQLALALAVLHQHGWLHLDVKPQNVLYDVGVR